MLSERPLKYADQKTERGKILNPQYSIDRDQPTSRASPLRINTLLSRVRYIDCRPEILIGDSSFGGKSPVPIRYRQKKPNLVRQCRCCNQPVNCCPSLQWGTANQPVRDLMVSYDSVKAAEDEEEERSEHPETVFGAPIFKRSGHCAKADQHNSGNRHS